MSIYVIYNPFLLPIINVLDKLKVNYFWGSEFYQTYWTGMENKRFLCKSELKLERGALEKPKSHKANEQTNPWLRHAAVLSSKAIAIVM